MFTYGVIMFILYLLMFRSLKFRWYKDKNFTKRVKIPLWGYIVYFIIGLIPFLNSVAYIAFSLALLTGWNENDWYFKPSKLLIFLNKNV